MKHELKRVEPRGAELSYERFAYNGYTIQLTFSVAGSEITQLQVYHDVISEPAHFTMINWFVDTDFFGRFFIWHAIPVIILFIDGDKFLELPANTKERPCYIDKEFMKWFEEQLESVSPADSQTVKQLLNENAAEVKRKYGAK